MNTDNFHEDFIKLLLSLLIGGIIGAEREYRSKSAGFRTLILVCVGSTLFTIFSIRIGGPNPDRIAANIITGIGFLGAGAIFRGDNKINGLTTATTIWMAAALGMGVGSGEYIICGVGTGAILIVLLLFTRLERLIDDSHQIRTYKIVCDFEENLLTNYEVIFKEYHLKSKGVSKSHKGGCIIGEWDLQGAKKNHDSLVQKLVLDKKIKEFVF
jgi:putative Mg2+ transporter-C (MgtC) family protein